MKLMRELEVGRTAALVALLAGCWLTGCTAFSSHDMSNRAVLPSSLRAIGDSVIGEVHEQGLNDFLYWSPRGPGAFFKLRISDGKQSKKTFGVPGFGTLALAVDHNQNLLQAFGNEGQAVGGFAIFDKRLNQVAKTMLPTGALAVAIASDGSDRVYLIVVTGPPSKYAIEIFKRGAQSPSKTIGGERTGIDGSIALAVDQNGYIYVAKEAFEKAPAGIEVFSPDAEGNVAPTRVIAGSATGLSTPTALVLGGDGNIYIANLLTAACNILVFPMGGDGNIAPVRELNSNEYGASIALDQSGQMYLGPGPFGESRGFAIFAAGASGNDAPIGFVGRQRFDENLYPGPLVIRYPWYVP